MVVEEKSGEKTRQSVYWTQLITLKVSINV